MSMAERIGSIIDLLLSNILCCNSRPPSAFLKKLHGKGKSHHVSVDGMSYMLRSGMSMGFHPKWPKFYVNLI